MKSLLRNECKHMYYFSPSIEPALRIDPGETVFIQTLDCFSGQIQSARDVDILAKMGKELQFNPIAGPVYVNGAEPGDNIVVTIENIVVGGPKKQGYFAIDEMAGILDYSAYTLNSPLGEPTVIVCKIEENELIVPIDSSGEVRIPINPIIGTIGVAPADMPVKSFWHTQQVCGNIDSPDMTIGTKLTLPVNVPGALLSVGDVAAISGDGEILSHVDTDGDLTLTIDLIKREDTQYIGWPQIETDEHIGSIGCEIGSSLIDSIRTASKDMVLRLNRYYGLDLMTAYTLHTLALEIRVNQAFINTLGGCCTAKMLKRYVTM